MVMLPTQLVGLCERSAGRAYNGNDPHREQNVANVPDAILHCRLFTTVLAAALNRNGL
jgi:hypothetical protein